MRKFVAQRAQYAVIAHEMGHSIGLRHNFVSTYAALHFRPQYWQLRTKNGAVTKQCTDAVDDGATCVGPRYFDPLTDEEQSQMIWSTAFTVMDYPGDVAGPIGLGARLRGGAHVLRRVLVYNPSLGPDYQAGARSASASRRDRRFGGLRITYARRRARAPARTPSTTAQADQYNINNCTRVAGAARTCEEPTARSGDGSRGRRHGRCRQLPVTTPWTEPPRRPAWDALRDPNRRRRRGYYDARRSIPTGPNRVPTSRRSLGRHGRLRLPHDNGADPYEQMMFPSPRR
jgi:hypothetical protein